ncbi:MAG: CapA family protein [Elusimicrobiota bacterium]|jgi:poly-gamma-glutamate synthesis protein (capsule biosynthesis protein)|nr:CapA family protein [Elusimicrobiota bacterium]
MDFLKLSSVLLFAALFSACSGTARRVSRPPTPSAPDNFPSHAAVVQPSAEEQPVITLTFAGDTTLGEYIGAEGMTFSWQYEQVKGDVSYFLKNMKPLFESDDITILNFEGTITEETNGKEKPFRFKAPKKYLKILGAASVEMVNLANNHTYDFGEQGYKDTKAALTEANIEYFGLQDVLIKEIKGSRLCFHGVKGWSWQRDSAMIKSHLNKFKDKCDFIVSVFHWGEEHQYVHNDLQEKLAKLAVDLGSNLIVGHHAHVRQDGEVYKNAPIYYGLGNFLFGGNKNPKDKNALVIQVFLQGGKIVKIDEIPIKISSLESRNNYQPTPLDTTKYLTDKNISNAKII